MFDNNEFLNFYYKQKGRNTSICLYPKEKCELKGINAHSIQNSKVFDLLEANGHLIGLDTIHNKNHEPKIVFNERIGRNIASTFKGLCSKHDAELFIEIDTNEIDFNNSEHLFLISYRSVLKELHAVIHNMIHFQSVFQKMLDLELTQSNINSKPGRLATERMMIAYETNLYCEHWDKALIEENWKYFDHEVILLENISPSIACSQLFTVNHIKFEDTVLRIVFNIVPINTNQTLVVFTFSKAESVHAKNYLYKCLTDNLYLKKYEISKMVIRNCENFSLIHYFINLGTKTKKQTLLIIL